VATDGASSKYVLIDVVWHAAGSAGESVRAQDHRGKKRANVMGCQIAIKFTKIVDISNAISMRITAEHECSDPIARGGSAHAQTRKCFDSNWPQFRSYRGRCTCRKRLAIDPESIGGRAAEQERLDESLKRVLLDAVRFELGGIALQTRQSMHETRIAIVPRRFRRCDIAHDRTACEHSRVVPRPRRKFDTAKTDDQNMLCITWQDKNIKKSIATGHISQSARA
jgi:hypothetical protein